MLYPQTNRHRIVISQNGLWKFQTVNDDYVPAEPLEDFRLIGVPGSYNDLFTEKPLRDHVGKVCYERTIAIPDPLQNWRLRIGAAGHRSKVYLDGNLIKEHNGGFLPIDCSLPIKEKHEYRLSIVLDNRLGHDTLPIGELDGSRQTIYFDFKNYTGIHRDVLLYSLPEQPIEDIVIRTLFKEDGVYVKYNVFTEATAEVLIVDPSGTTVAQGVGNENTIRIDNPILWDLGAGNLYQLKVSTANDSYTESFGIMKIEVVGDELRLNGRKIHLKGFGMHEDHETVGKASLSALNIRDFNLLRWINANSFRTSHYPYAEEMYDLADRFGIAVISEMPAVGINYWNPRSVFAKGRVDETTKKVYLEQFDELISRDKNHPSIILYSIANEAKTSEDNAYPFFRDIFSHIRTCTALPLMIVETVEAEDNKVAQLADVIGINRYLGWYVDLAELDSVEANLEKSLQSYHNRFHKPLILTEFGADTIAGLHRLPSVAFSEEFQVEFIERYLEVVRRLDYVVGEHVWNFADFDTKQGLTRIDGNKKGVFTRNRQPKLAAHFLKRVWED